MSDLFNELEKLLEEANMQMTFTGWKKELEACEKELTQLKAENEKLRSEIKKEIDKRNVYKWKLEQVPERIIAAFRRGSKQSKYEMMRNLDFLKAIIKKDADKALEGSINSDSDTTTTDNYTVSSEEVE